MTGLWFKKHSAYHNRGLVCCLVGFTSCGDGFLGKELKIYEPEAVKRNTYSIEPEARSGRLEAGPWFS
jgi:hypothetical protein